MALVVVLLALAGTYAWRHFQLEHQDERQSLTPYKGNIDVRQVNLGFKVEGRIASLAVDEGDEVNRRTGDRDARQELLRR